MKRNLWHPKRPEVSGLVQIPSSYLSLRDSVRTSLLNSAQWLRQSRFDRSVQERTVRSSKVVEVHLGARFAEAGLPVSSLGFGISGHTVGQNERLTTRFQLEVE